MNPDGDWLPREHNLVRVLRADGVRMLQHVTEASWALVLLKDVKFLQRGTGNEEVCLPKADHGQ